MSGFLVTVLILALFAWAVIASVWAVEARQRMVLAEDLAEAAEARLRGSQRLHDLRRLAAKRADPEAVAWAAEAEAWQVLREADAGVRDMGRRWER